jgi:hypothetical protein
VRARSIRPEARAVVREVLHGPRPQAKLTVGPSDDRYEREADEVAERVMRMPVPGTEVPSPTGRRPGAALQRACAECEEERLQRVGTGAPTLRPESEAELRRLRGRGEPLPESARRRP